MALGRSVSAPCVLGLKAAQQQAAHRIKTHRGSDRATGVGGSWAERLCDASQVVKAPKFVKHQCKDAEIVCP